MTKTEFLHELKDILAVETELNFLHERVFKRLDKLESLAHKYLPDEGEL